MSYSVYVFFFSKITVISNSTSFYVALAVLSKRYPKLYCLVLELKASLLGVSDGSPDVKHELVGEGEVSQSLVQSHGELVRVHLVSSNLHHRGR